MSAHKCFNLAPETGLLAKVSILRATAIINMAIVPAKVRLCEFQVFLNFVAQLKALR